MGGTLCHCTSKCATSDPQKMFLFFKCFSNFSKFFQELFRKNLKYAWKCFTRNIYVEKSVKTCGKYVCKNVLLVVSQCVEIQMASVNLNENIFHSVDHVGFHFETILKYCPEQTNLTFKKNLKMMVVTWGLH